MPGRSDSVSARGMAARAREQGLQRGVPGFEAGGEGKPGGAKRQAANAIVHEDLGKARGKVNEAKRLLNQAANTPDRYTHKK